MDWLEDRGFKPDLVEGGRKKKEYGISPDATEAEPN
jgi:hypothetical protein